MQTLIRKLIVFLVRKKLGLKVGERFQFVNQKDKSEIYWFNDICMMKQSGKRNYRQSSVAFNHLISDNCKIQKVEVTWNPYSVKPKN